jgi:hypothetical protein
MADRSRCPNCKEPVSPFAAGCAVCGADLDTRRWDTGPGLGTRVGSWFSSLGAGPSLPSGMGWLIALFLVLFGGAIVGFLLNLF